MKRTGLGSCCSSKDAQTANDDDADNELNEKEDMVVFCYTIITWNAKAGFQT